MKFKVGNKTIDLKLRRQGDVALLGVEEFHLGAFEPPVEPESLSRNGNDYTVIEHGEGVHSHVIKKSKAVSIKRTNIKEEVFKKNPTYTSILRKALLIEVKEDGVGLEQISLAEDGVQDNEALHGLIPTEKGNWIAFPQQVEFVDKQPRLNLD